MKTATKSVSVSLALALGLGAGVGAGCNKSSEPTPPSSKPMKPEVAEPAFDAGAPSAKAEGPSRSELIAKTVAKVPEIVAGVAEVRGLAPKSQVPAEEQSQADFRTFVERELETEMPPEKSHKAEKLLVRIGLLKADVDLAKVLSDAMVSQAAAYYDPEQKKFFVVMTPGNDMQADTIAAHELDHALQDQYFDLQKYLGETDGKPTTLTEDESNARRYVVEGEATLVMMAYMAKEMTHRNVLDGDMAAALKPQIAMFSHMDAKALAATAKQQASLMKDLGPDMQAAVAAMDKIPLYVLVPLMGSYMQGVVPIYEAYLAGGWKKVNELYANPPDSTEQVLHPKEKLVDKRDYPVALTLGTPKGWDEIERETLGELNWRIYFQLWDEPKAEDVAAGWDGDRVAAFSRGDEVVALIATTWDSAKEATEFESAYRATLPRRYPTGTPPVQVERKGSDVFIVDGSTDPAMMKLARAAKKKRNPKDR